MTRPLGSTDVSASGGTMRLIGRTGESRLSLHDAPMPMDEAVAALAPICEPPAAVAEAGPLVPPGRTGYWAPGTPLTWVYHLAAQMAVVVEDGPEGLGAWIPSGSGRLVKRALDGREGRAVALAERFTTAWEMHEATWTGPGILRWVPTGMPWSLWFFTDDDGFWGTYVNIEAPHRRPADGTARTHSRDLDLDLWIQPGDDGGHEIWVKDEDEVDAATASGRYSPLQREALVSLGEHAARLLFDAGVDMGERPTWRPTPELDRPLPLPHDALVDALRRQRG